MPKLSKNAKKKTICLGIRISEDLNEQLMDYSGKKGLTVSQVVRIAIAEKISGKKAKEIVEEMF